MADDPPIKQEELHNETPLNACHGCVGKRRAHLCDYDGGNKHPCTPCLNTRDRNGNPLRCVRAGKMRTRGVFDGRIDPRDIQPNGRGRGRVGAPRSGAPRGRGGSGSGDAQSFRPQILERGQAYDNSTADGTMLRRLHEALDKKDEVLKHKEVVLRDLKQACEGKVQLMKQECKKKDEILEQERGEKNSLLKLKDERIEQMEDTIKNLIAQLDRRDPRSRR